ncbi:MAG: hypothetical protein E6767_13070 [Dysgonomonas sp.]|nr:hypothetical protein [Dysgonomonas sp.]
MKKKLYRYFAIMMIASIGLFGFTGCGDDKNYYYTGADTQSYEFTVKYEDWEWNDARGRFEYAFKFDGLAADVFNDGAVLGFVYVEEGSTLTQKIMPYVQTYMDNGKAFTETIGYDISLVPKEILFFVQTSDLDHYDDRFIDTYKFKVTLVWRLE